MISGGDFAVFLIAVLIVISFFVIMRRFIRRAEEESGPRPGRDSKH